MFALILTDVGSLGGADIRQAPAIVGYMTVEVAAALTGVSPKTIRNDLSEFKDRFDTPCYQRSPGKRWGKRLITARDLDTLRRMYPRLSSYK